MSVLQLQLPGQMRGLSPFLQQQLLQQQYQQQLFQMQLVQQQLIQQQLVRQLVIQQLVILQQQQLFRALLAQNPPLLALVQQDPRALAALLQVIAQHQALGLPFGQVQAQAFLQRYQEQADVVAAGQQPQQRGQALGGLQPKPGK
jgi:hypothetical protein